MRNNNARMGRGFYLLKLGLDSFIPQTFLNHYADGAAPALEEILGPVKNEQKLFVNMKTQDLLTVLHSAWDEVFSPSLTGIEPNQLREIKSAHETWARRQPLSNDTVYRALTATQALLMAMALPTANELGRIKLEFLEGVDVIEFAESAGFDLLPITPEPVPPDPPAPEPPPITTDPYPAELIQALQKFGALQPSDQVHLTTRERVEPEYVSHPLRQGAGPLNRSALTDDLAPQPPAEEEPEPLPGLAQTLAALDADRWQRYQIATLADFLAGANGVLRLPSPTGKTRFLSLLLSQALAQNPAGRVLILCPSPRVATAQIAWLKPFLAPLGLAASASVGEPEDYAPPAQAESSVAGETNAAATDANDDSPPTVVVATPESLNQAILPARNAWRPFLQSLRLIVIDDAHEYSGYLGANTAALLRRLAHHLKRSGVSPQYFMAAAYGSNLQEHAENLTGQTFAAEHSPANGLPAPRRHYLAVDPDISNPDTPDTADAIGSSEFQGRISRAALACLELGKTVLVICPHQKFADRCFALAQKEAAERNLTVAAIGLDPANLNPSSSAQVKQQLEDGSLKILFSTYGAVLDWATVAWEGLILAGWSGLMAMNGHEEGEVFALGYALNHEDGIDQFYLRNLPDFLEPQGFEIVAEPDHEEAIRDHLPLLVREAEGRAYSFSAEILGPSWWRALAQYRPAKLDTAAAPELPGGPRSGSSGSLPFSSENLPDERLEIMAERRLVLEPSGVTVAWGQLSRQAGLTAAATALAIDGTTIAATDPSDPANNPTDSAADTPPRGDTFGAFWLDLSTLMDGVRADAADDVAFGLRVADGAQTFVDASQENLAADLAAVEQMLLAGTLLSFPVNFYAVATASSQSKIFLLEKHPATLGLARRVFDRWRDVLARGLQAAKNCQCASACHRCLLLPRSYDRTLDKVGGIRLAEKLLAATERPPAENAAAE